MVPSTRRLAPCAVPHCLRLALSLHRPALVPQVCAPGGREGPYCHDKEGGRSSSGVRACEHACEVCARSA
eukprot:1056380-Pleurochrysis_carterae.AAC.1